MENKNEKSMTLEEMIGEMLKDAKVVKVPLPVKAEEEKKAQKQDKPMPARPLGAPLLSINIENLHLHISFANIFEPKSINGGEAKYSVSCLIPKEDKKTLLAIHKAVEAAKEDGKTRKWGGKIPPNLKLPLRDGDIDRPDDENYQEHFFVNASSKDAPQVVDRHVQPVTDPMMVYSGCYCNVSVNFYAFNANGNRGVAAGLGNVQFVKDGERLSGKASAESDFDALDDEDVLGGDAGEELPDYLR